MKSDSRSLRTFGLMVGAIFLLLGVWPAVVGGEGPRWWAVIVALLLLTPALVYPRALGPIHKVWMQAGHVLGWINTRIILSILFYLVFTPVGVVMRWLGRDPMQRRFDPRATSYRSTKTTRPASHMRNQF